MTIMIYVFSYITWGVCSAALFLILYKKWKEKTVLSHRIKMAHAQLLNMPKITGIKKYTFFSKFAQKVEERADIAGFRWSFKFYAITSVVLGLAGMIVGTFMFHSLKLTVLLGIAFLLLPDQTVNFGISNERQKLSKQMLHAVGIFATEYGDTKNIQKAMSATYPQLQEPIRNLFEVTSRRLNNNEDYHIVFNDLAKHLQNNFGDIFCNTCITIYERGGDGKQFENIQGNLAKKMMREQENKTQLLVPKILALGLLALTPVLFIINVRLLPGTYDLFTKTVDGRDLMTWAVLSAIIGFFVNKLLSKVGD